MKMETNIGTKKAKFLEPAKIKRCRKEAKSKISMVESKAQNESHWSLRVVSAAQLAYPD